MANLPEFTPEQGPTASPARNTLGGLGFVLGLAGLVLSFVPDIRVIATVIAAVGVVSSAFGLKLANKRAATAKGLAVAGLVLSIIAIVNCRWELTL